MDVQNLAGEPMLTVWSLLGALLPVFFKALAAALDQTLDAEQPD